MNSKMPDLTSYEKHLVAEFLESLNKLSKSGLFVERLGPVKMSLFNESMGKTSAWELVVSRADKVLESYELNHAIPAEKEPIHGKETFRLIMDRMAQVPRGS